MGERVAITAVALRVADLPTDTETVGLLPLEGFDASGFGDPLGAQIWRTPEEPEDDPALRILGPHGRLFDALARAVHEDAGLASYPRERVGLFAGMGMVDSPVGDLITAAASSRSDDGVDWEAFYGGAYRAIHPLWPLSMLNNVAVGQVSIDLDIRGDNLVLASDAVAGLRALLEAAASVRDDACDAAVVGAVSGRIGPAALARLALEDRADIPLGEGGAAFVFERERVARDRGARIHGYLSGAATAFGALDGMTGPSANAVTRAVAGAIARSGREPEDIDEGYLPVRCGSQAHDALIEGLGQAGFLPRLVTQSWCEFGHLGAGAPAADLAIALQRLQGRAPEDETWRGAVVVAFGADGGVGALVVEAA